MGPYKIAIANQAEKISYETLREEVKTRLCKDVAFDSETHHLFKVPIGIEFISLNSHRKNKKFSLEKTDKVLIELRIPDQNIYLAGIFPNTIGIKSEAENEFEGQVLFEVNFKVVKFQLSGKLKKKLRQNQFQIFASRIPPDKAQWIYTKAFLLSGKSFDNYILCTLPKDQEIKNYIYCRAESSSRNRTICKVMRKKVLLGNS